MLIQLTNVDNELYEIDDAESNGASMMDLAGTAAELQPMTTLICK